MEYSYMPPEPLSPMAQCLDSSSFCLYILAVWEFEVHIPHSSLLSFLRDTLLSIPRFTSILVSDKKGVKRWERVEVKLEDHIIEVEPELFSHGMMLMEDLYAMWFNEYLSKLGMEKLSHSKPLWEVHMIKYPTNTTLVFKVHHSIGDGYTMMGVLSGLKRADDPSLPLSFPSLKSSKTEPNFPNQSSLKKCLNLSKSFFTSITDFASSLLKSTIVEDHKTPIRCRNDGIDFGPSSIFNLTFPMDHIKDIKFKLGVTVNDVITGIIFYGIRLYMQDIDYSSGTKDVTLLPMLNIRNVKSYQTVKDAETTKEKSNWGNKFTYMHVSVPKLEDVQLTNPLEFVWEVHHLMNTRRRFLVSSLIRVFLRMIHKYKGAESMGKHFHKTMRNSSLLISNMAGPVDQLALANHPMKDLYFTLSGVPQILVITIVSYMEKLKVTIRTEEGFIDEKKLASYVNNAFEIIHKAALDIPTKSYSRL